MEQSTTYYHFNENPTLPVYETPNGVRTYYRYEYRNTKKSYDYHNCDNDPIRHGNIVLYNQENYYVDSGDPNEAGKDLNDPYVKIIGICPGSNFEERKSVLASKLILQCKYEPRGC